MDKHSVRDVKNTFEEILGGNAETLREIDKTIAQAQSDIGTVEDLYSRAIDKFASAQVRPMNSDMLKTLSAIAGKGRDFEQEYKDAAEASRKAEIRLNGLVTTQGSESQLRDQLQKLNGQAQAADAAITQVSDTLRQINRTLSGVDDFNFSARASGKPQLAAGEIDYFSSKKGISHVWSWMFDGHYRSGRALIKSADIAGHDIPAMQSSREEQKSTLRSVKEQSADVTDKAQKTEKQLQETRSTAAQVIGDYALRENLKKEIVKSFDDIGFMNKVAHKLGGAFPVFAVEQRAKLENLRKILGGAQKTKQTVQDAGGKLDKHMSKLRRAASSSGSTKISIDLNGIKTNFGTMQASVKTQAVQLRQTSAAVRDYKPAATSSAASGAAAPVGGMDPVFFMAVIMMSDIQHTAVPDVSVPANIGDSFNSAAIDNVNIGNLDNISVPDIAISVPDISVPDISVSVSDSFSGGGFDGGSF